MTDTLNSVLIGAVAGLLSAVITHFATRAKIRLDLAAEYDKGLQESRLAAYKVLWEMFERLARYGRDEPITYAILRDISGKSKTWYFRTGGIYLTRASAAPYFAWKAAMQPVLDDAELAKRPDAPIPKDYTETINIIVRAASTLRTSLSEDIGTRRLSRL
jgi:hypothetical protein